MSGPSTRTFTGLPALTDFPFVANESRLEPLHAEAARPDGGADLQTPTFPGEPPTDPVAPPKGPPPPPNPNDPDDDEAPETPPTEPPPIPVVDPPDEPTNPPLVV